MSAARAAGLLLGVVADSVAGGRDRPRAAEAFAAVTGRTVGSTQGSSGAAVSSGVAIGAAVLAGYCVERATRGRPLLRMLGTAAGSWAVLGGVRLAADGTALARELETGDLPATRATLSAWESRDTTGLDATALARASVEAVAGNTASTVVVPLFWGAVAGVPGLLGSRALGLARAAGPGHGRAAWVLTRLDDVAALVPTRATAALTVAAAPVVGGSASSAWRAWRRDTVLHPSPNEGRVEAAFAGALEVRLGGRAAYPEGVRELPVLGDGRNPDAGHVTRAVELSRVVGWFAAGAAAALAFAARLRARGARDGHRR